MTGKKYSLIFFPWRLVFIFFVSGANGQTSSARLQGTKPREGFVPGAWGTPQRAAHDGTPCALLAGLLHPPKKPDLATALPLLFSWTQGKGTKNEF